MTSAMIPAVGGLRRKRHEFPEQIIKRLPVSVGASQPTKPPGPLLTAELTNWMGKNGLSTWSMGRPKTVQLCSAEIMSTCTSKWPADQLERTFGVGMRCETR